MFCCYVRTPYIVLLQHSIKDYAVGRRPSPRDASGCPPPLLVIYPSRKSQVLTIIHFLSSSVVPHRHCSSLLHPSSLAAARSHNCVPFSFLFDELRLSCHHRAHWTPAHSTHSLAHMPSEEHHSYTTLTIYAFNCCHPHPRQAPAPLQLPEFRLNQIAATSTNQDVASSLATYP